MQLSPHFTYEEMVASTTASQMGIKNQPNAGELDHLHALCRLMESVRAKLGSSPITITSGFRCPELNAAVGGVPDSHHTLGLACDFICPGFADPRTICKTLEPFALQIGWDQLILEYGDWVHLSAPTPGTQPRHECLTISSSGTSTGFS